MRVFVHEHATTQRQMLCEQQQCRLHRASLHRASHQDSCRVTLHRWRIKVTSLLLCTILFTNHLGIAECVMTSLPDDDDDDDNSAPHDHTTFLSFSHKSSSSSSSDNLLESTSSSLLMSSFPLGSSPISVMTSETVSSSSSSSSSESLQTVDSQSISSSSLSATSSLATSSSRSLSSLLSYSSSSSSSSLSSKTLSQSLAPSKRSAFTSSSSSYTPSLQSPPTSSSSSSSSSSLSSSSLLSPSVVSSALSTDSTKARLTSSHPSRHGRNTSGQQTPSSDTSSSPSSSSTICLQASNTNDFLNRTRSAPEKLQCLGIAYDVCEIAVDKKRAGNTSRVMELRRKRLPFCDRFSAARVLDLNKCNLDSLPECYQCIAEVEAADDRAEESYRNFKMVIKRYDCNSGSNKWTCDQCLSAYKDWVCAVASGLHFYHQNASIPPCSTYCKRVEERCPYFLPQFNNQYAGEPYFLCNDYDDIPSETSLSACHEPCNMSGIETTCVNKSSISHTQPAHSPSGNQGNPTHVVMVMNASGSTSGAISGKLLRRTDVFTHLSYLLAQLAVTWYNLTVRQRCSHSTRDIT